jgi:hypothetical protein
MRNSNEMNENDVKEILNEFGVKTEDELSDKVNKTWNLVKCSRCGRKIDLTSCNWEDGDPVCANECWQRG